MPEALEATETTEETLAQPAETADVENPVEQVTQDVSAEVNAGGGEVAPEVNAGADEELVQLAEVYGVQYSDPASLVKHLANTFHRELSQLGRQTDQPTNGQQANGQQAQAASQSGFELEKLIGELLPEAEVDATLRKGVQSLFAKVVDHFGQQHKALRDEFGKTYAQRVESVERFLQQQEQVRVDSEIDAFFAEQSQEWTGEFGKGSIKDLSPHSQHAHARNRVVEMAAGIKRSLEDRGKSPSIKQALNLAKGAIYADRHTTIAKQQVAETLNKRKNAALSRPAAKAGKPLSAEEQTLAKLKEWVARVES